ncbi:nuclear transport factor 2 family protein [Hyphomonas sp.]|jgi:ketosteroid isomerase-like protein|uniref:nuclear transport factor 2 family protein n=1 Tax=Hyphomonas sp. TaxID=87 RepID=UPI0025C49000|nr:nuclear transport factor 2 family protein [Hyphomonas sp.]
MDHGEIAKQLFAALARQDDAAVRRLCAPDMRVRQNNGRPMSLDTLLRFNAAVGRVVKDFRYEDAVRSATGTGFVEEHAVRGTLPDGKALDLAVCVVADVKDGRVTNVREYLDSAAAAGLSAALA